jgi:hypothetical protein
VFAISACSLSVILPGQAQRISKSTRRALSSKISVARRSASSWGRSLIQFFSAAATVGHDKPVYKTRSMSSETKRFSSANRSNRPGRRVSSQPVGRIGKFGVEQAPPQVEPSYRVTAFCQPVEVTCLNQIEIGCQAGNLFWPREARMSSLFHPKMRCQELEHFGRVERRGDGGRRTLKRGWGRQIECGLNKFGRGRNRLPIFLQQSLSCCQRYVRYQGERYGPGEIRPDL